MLTKQIHKISIYRKCTCMNPKIFKQLFQQTPIFHVHALYLWCFVAFFFIKLQDDAEMCTPFGWNINNYIFSYLPGSESM